jgi:hypothetical protein
MPGGHIFFRSIGMESVIEAFKNKFVVEMIPIPKQVGKFHGFMQFWIIMDDATVPDDLSIEIDDKTVVNIAYFDPVFFFHDVQFKV